MTVAGALAGTVPSTSLAQEGDWTETDVPTESGLASAANSLFGPVAVGDGGTLISRTIAGWETLLETGPTTESNPLNDAAVTDDGEHVWFAGGSGVIGQYDIVEHELTDYSAPGVEEEDGSINEMTSTWEALDVAGDAGEEQVVLANGSGEVLAGEKTAEGGMDWGTVVEPGSGTTITGVSLYEVGSGFVCDTEGAVYETKDGGESWTEIGIYADDTALQDVSAVAGDDATTVGESGSVFEYNGVGWEEIDVGEEAVLAVFRDGQEGLAAGGSGFVYERTEEDDWEQLETPAESDLRGVTLNDTDQEFPDVAVGAGPTAIERGEYVALPQSITLSNDVSATIEYRIEIEGEAEAVDADADVEDGTVTGALEGGDTHEFAFDGRIVDFEVTQGPLPQLTVEVNGVEVTPLRLADLSWRAADSPVGSVLGGVAATSAPIAVGEGGVVLRREDDTWFAIEDDGPTGNSSALLDAAATDDGEAGWIAGSSGVIARYDVEADEFEDYSAPMEMTSTWEAVAVGGDADEERLVFANGSGEVLSGRYDGETVEWGEAVKPGGGSSVGGAAFLDESTVYVTDTNSMVYRSDDGGERWESIGVDGASVALYDVAASAEDDVSATGGDGSVFRYNGAVWTKNDAGEESLFGIDRDLDYGIAVGGSGSALTRRLYRWEEDETPTDATLQDVVFTDDFLEIAVGEDGTILERDRD